MEGYKEITIKWSYPKEFDIALASERMNDIGIYYISRVFGDKETLLYIGKTTASFGSRLKDHKAKWLDDYRGTKYVRLGEIVEPKDMSVYDTAGYINDAEKTIIFYLTQIQEQELPANVTSTNSTYPLQDLIINNTGYGGDLPKRLFIPEEYNAE